MTQFSIFYFCIAVNFLKNGPFDYWIYYGLFKGHMYLASSILLEYVLCLKSLVWFPNRFLNGVSANRK